MTDAVSALADGVADRLWHRIQVRDRLDALDEQATGPTHRERVIEDPAGLAASVEEVLGTMLAAVADGARRSALRGLRNGDTVAPGADVDALLDAGLAVTSWGGDSVAASDAGRAAGELCDEVAALATERLRRRLRGDG
jgi:hypothetical protein